MSSNRDFIAVWIDKNISKKDEQSELKKRLEAISNAISRWVYIDKDEDLLDFFENHRADKILLISSGSAAKRTLGLVSLEQNLRSVFIFCGQKESYEKMCEDEPKIRCVCDKEDQLCEALTTYLNAEILPQ